MKIFVKAVPNSKQQRIAKMSDSIYKVWVKSKPVEGRANTELILLLSNYFDVPKNNVRISGGATFREKIVEIVDGG